VQDITPEDRYHIIKAQMDADKKLLESKKSQQDLDRLMLELHYKYGLITTGGSIDPRSGSIIQQTNPAQKTNGKEKESMLEDTVVTVSN
tara:strand:+ start:31 stop:297 length:267 start_codon:yes stop_codon:yes gene_type:complete